MCKNSPRQNVRFQAAWRRLLDGGAKEKAARLQAPPDAQPSDDAEAVWPDGMTWRVPSITVKELDAKGNCKNSSTYLELDRPDGRLALKKVKNGDKLIAAMWHTVLQDDKKKDVQVAQMILNGLTGDQQAFSNAKTFEAGEMSCLCFTVS